MREPHARPKPRASRSALIRDTATILGAAVLAVVASQVLPTGGAAPSPADSAIVEGSGLPVESTAAAAGTIPGLETVGPIVNPSSGIGATPTPVPFTTLGPTTLTVVVDVTNDNGGNDVASGWTISVSGAGASPAVFSGAEAGTTISMNPGQTFTITSKPKTAGGYVEARSGNCTGPIAKGASPTCTITENDKPVTMTVAVKGATGVKVTVTAPGVDKPSFTGTSAGTVVHFNANAAWAVTTTPASIANYTRTTSGSCSSKTGAAEGAAVSCTITFIYNPTPTPPPPPPVAAFSCVPSAGLVLTCSDSSTGVISSWSWDWGDGTSYSGQNPPAHTYPLGTVSATVTLTVTGPGGSKASSQTYTLVP